MIDKQRLIDKAAACGLDIAHAADGLAKYAEILVDYNQKVNLTAITDPEGIEDKHFIDSLLFAAQPELELCLMEPTGKRLDFLRYLCGELGIEAEFAKERAEEAARKRWREQFDVASARGVARLNMLCEYCLPLVKPGGVFIAMKAAAADEELAEAKGAIARLGGEYWESRRARLPQGDERSLIVVKKISQTPPVYPRNGGKIAKSPLK